ncbi:hypothetical protein BKA93DRAFT_36115 [Sparassis latifolia]
MGVPNVSERRFIRWVPEDPSEPTSTLVLTSEHSYFVDIRVLKDSVRDAADTAGIDWAFAGSSVSRPAHEEKGCIVPAHSVWTHWVDSRVPYDGEASSDEGNMWTQPDGDVLEKGSMVRPETGHLTEYEELWADVDVQRTGDDLKKVCVVLTVDDPTRRARGMVVRVGQWCQGITKVGGELLIERWKYGMGEVLLTESSCWSRIFKIGQPSLDLPCFATFIPERVSIGHVFDAGDLQWRVTEKSEW